MEHVEGSRHLEDHVREVELRRGVEDTWELLTRNQTGYVATTLVKQSALRVVLIAMKGGATIPGHRANAEITVQVLRGLVLFRLGDDARWLEPGKLLAVSRGLEHDLAAVSDSDVLLTLSWG